MNPPPSAFDRRHFLRSALALASSAPLALSGAWAAAEERPRPSDAPRCANATVAIVSCRGYGPEVRAALSRAFDLLGGIGSLVRRKTVTVKLNLTGTDFAPFAGRPAGESYVTHFATAHALAGLLFEAGARRVRFVESTQSRDRLEQTLLAGRWDVNGLRALGAVEFENTRNLGTGTKYSELKVPHGGLLFSHFLLNHAYEETDVMVSLCKLKQHVTAGVTLSMKNLFGITPNSLYGDQAGSEDALGGRAPLHTPDGRVRPPGLRLKPADEPRDAGMRVPRIIADLCAARPIHLAIIDGITAMEGGEGPWCGGPGQLRLTQPGVLIAGLNPVSTDAVGAAVMGCANPRAPRGTPPFALCENHLLLAEQAGLGTADLARIDVRGLSIPKALHPYRNRDAKELLPGRERAPIKAEEE